MSTFEICDATSYCIYSYHGKSLFCSKYIPKTKY